MRRSTMAAGAARHGRVASPPERPGPRAARRARDARLSRDRGRNRRAARSSAAGRPSCSAGSAGTTAGRSRPAISCRWVAGRTCCSPLTSTAAADLATAGTSRVIPGPHGAPDHLTADGVDAFFAQQVDCRPPLRPHRGPAGRPVPGWARSDGGEAGLHPSNVHDSRLPGRRHHAVRRHPGDRRPGRAEPRRLRRAGGGDRGGSLDARPAASRATPSRLVPVSSRRRSRGDRRRTRRTLAGRTCADRRPPPRLPSHRSASARPEARCRSTCRRHTAGFTIACAGERMCWSRPVRPSST